VKQLVIMLGLLMPLSASAAGIDDDSREQRAVGTPTIDDDGVMSDGVDVIERLGESASIDVPLVNQDGKIVRLRDYLGKGRPVMLALVYYRCPTLCGVMLQGITQVLQKIDWKVGREFDVLTVSIDPTESTELAKEKRRGFLQALGRPEEEAKADGVWPFFTASEEAIEVLAASLGFQFKYVARERQFAHVAALFFLSPKGNITRYLYGVQFDPKEVKLALFESSEGRVGTPLERVLLRCYKYDPASRRYHNFIRTYYRVWGVIILLCLGTFLGVLWRREFTRGKAPKASTWT
jgi:protein SCO1/2